MKQGGDQFFSESTPVVDMKKTSGVKDVNWDNEKTEVYLEDEGGGSAYLVDNSGEYNPITAFPFVIGRGNECDLVLTGKGVSRKHVEIVFQSGRFVVNDLDSLNGMKVNGYKVARVILEEGDEIRLGEVALTFTSSRGSSSKTNKSTAEKGNGGNAVGESGNAVSKKNVDVKKVISRSIIAISLVGIVGAAYVYFQKAQMPVGEVATQVAVVPANQNSTQESIDTVTSQAPQSQNQTSADSVDQNNDTAAFGANAAQSSDDSSSQVQDMSVIGAEPPPSLMTGMPPPAVVAPKAKEAAPKVAAKPSQSVKAKVPVERPTTKPAVAIVEQKAAPATPAKVPAQNIGSLSQYEQVYVKGEADRALRELKALAENNTLNPVQRAEAKRKHEQLLGLFNQYASGSQAYSSGNKDQALALWSSYLEKEKQYFNGKKSVYTAMVASKVVDEYVARGNSASKSGDHHSAYKSWQRALSYGDSVAARIAIDGANQKAKQLYRQALRLEYVNTSRAKELWQQVIDLVPPGTEYYTKASSKIAWYDKWGA